MANVLLDTVVLLPLLMCITPNTEISRIHDLSRWVIYGRSPRMNGSNRYNIICIIFVLRICMLMFNRFGKQMCCNTVYSLMLLL